MTNTSKALKRLGVVGIAAITIGAGLPTLLATPASANHVTGVTLSPDQQLTQINQCAPFTINVAPASSTTVDVQIEQITTQQTVGGTSTASQIGFCTVTTAAGPNPQLPGTAPNSSGGTTTTNSGGTASPTGAGAACPPSSATPSGTTTTNTSRCTAEFQTDASGNVTFGVISDREGQVNVTAFAEEPIAGGGTQGNRTGNNVPNTGEFQETSQLTVVTNNQTAVTGVDCEPETARGQAGTANFVTFQCTVTAANAQRVNGAQLQYVITRGVDATQTPTTCSDATGNTFTNQNGQINCRVTNTSGTAGTDTVFIYAEANNQAGPQASEFGDEVTAVFSGRARTIDCAPNTANNNVGTEQVIECTVTDVNNVVVAGVDVDFQLTGVGRITNTECFNASSGNDVCRLTTNSAGLVRLFVRSDANGTATVTGTIVNAGGTTASSECRQAAGATTQPGVNASGRPAGVCSETVTRTFGPQTASPGPTGTATSTATATATATTTTTQTATQTATANPTAPTQKLGLTVSTGTITPGQQAILQGTGQANAVVILRCYSRPSTEYFDARTVPLGENGQVEFRLNPGTNTRCFLKYQGTTDSDARNSASVVQNVATALSLSVRRLGVRSYVFEGRILPRRADQLITLYRVDSSGREVLTAQVKTDATGTWRINRTFTGSGTFNFIARTGQNLTNVAGKSNVRPTAIF